MRSMGIVLKTFFPKKSKVALLDQQVGRIDATFMHARSFFPGALLTYSLKKDIHGYRLSDISLEDAPLSMARAHVLFIHHVLEILYHFIPEGSCIKDVYDLVLILFTRCDSFVTPSFTRLFLFRLLTVIGMYPETRIFSPAQLALIESISVDRLHEVPIDLECIQSLDRWLRQCIGVHPLVEQFNTLHFLMNHAEDNEK